MTDADCPQAKLLEELSFLRQQVTALQVSATQLQAQGRSLEQRNQVLESLLASLPNALLRVDRNWRYTYLNDEAEQLLGRSRSELLGRSAWEVFPSLIETQAYRLCHQAMDQQIDIRYEEFYPEFNKWFSIHLRPSVDGLTNYFEDITERKQVEAERNRLLALEQAACQEAEIERGRLREVFDCLPALFAVVRGPEHVFEFANPFYYQVVGRSPEILGLSMSQVFPELQGQKYFEILDQVYRSGEVIVGEESLVIWDRQGQGCLEQGYFNFVYHPLKDSQGQVQSILMYGIEVTAQVQARQQVEELLTSLRDSEERLRIALQNAPITIFNQDRELRYTWIYNPALGHQDVEVLGHRDQELLSDQDATLLTRIKQQVLDTGINAREEVKVTRHGQDFYFDLTVEPLKDANQEIVGVTCAAIDISTLKRTELALRKSETVLQAFLASSPIGMAFVDRDLHYIYANEALATINGIPLEQHLGRTLFEVLPDWAEQLAPTFYQIMETQQSCLNQAVSGVTNPVEGRYWHCLVNYFPVGLPDGQVLGVGVTSMDVSELKRVEAEREQLLIREQKARQEAEAANRIKDEFLAVLSHELRTPLNPILGWTQLLRSRQFDPARTALALETIERNAKLQIQLIEDLLDVSRILRGKLSLHITPVNLSDTIDQALETVHLAAEAKAIQIQTQLPAIATLVAGDANRLQQVLWNLLSNAVKFTPEGGQITVFLMAKGGLAEIQVTDTGKGIAADFLPHVFEYFRQADSATTRAFGGLGLGLAIVRHIVELHGGTITAASAGEGLGATFTVCLPLMSISSLPQTVQPAQLTRWDLQGTRILVVDDEADSRELIAFVLEEAGAEVMTTAAAPEVFRQLSHFLPHLLVSDIGMPQVDGYMLIQQLRTLAPEQGGKIPAIALTAYASPTDQQRVLADGFQAHLTKPVEPEVLVQTIAQLLQAPSIALPHCHLSPG